MKAIEENYELDIQYVRKLIYGTSSIILISTIIALFGYFLHSMGVFSFFIMIIGNSFMFMIVIGAERFEIHNRYNGKDT